MRQVSVAKRRFGSFATLQPPGWRGSYALHRDQTGILPIRRKEPLPDVSNRRKTMPLFDHLVGDREHIGPHLDAERTRRLHVDGEYKLCRLDNGQFAGLGAP